MAAATSPRESLAEILRVERVGEDEFTARCEDFWGQALGGDVLGRAALAAAESCEGMQLHSLHASYLRPVPPGVVLRLCVERLADEADSARRAVRIEASGLLCVATAGFAPPGAGLGWQDAKPPDGLPPPDSLPSTLEKARAEGWSEYARGPLEFRRVHPRVWPDPAHDTSGGHVEWLRPRRPLPDDSSVHAAALVFLADFYPHWPFERRAGDGFAVERFRPLDLALWLHEPVRWDDWLLLDARSEAARAGLALSESCIFTRDGRLVASAAQQARVAVR